MKVLLCSVAAMAEKGDLSTLELKEVSAPVPLYAELKTVSEKQSLLVKKLFAAEKQQRLNQFEACAKTLRGITKTRSQLHRLWVQVKRQHCELEAFKRSSEVFPHLLRATKQVIDQWEDTPSYLQVHAKDTLVKASLEILKRAGPRSDQWLLIDFFQKNFESFDSDAVYAVLLRAGELAEGEAKKSSALQYFLQAYKLKASPSLKARIVAIDATVLKPEAEVPPEAPYVVSLQEQKSYENYSKQMKLSNYLASIEKGVDYLKKFPQGRWSDKVAASIGTIYLRISGTGEQLILARQQAVKKMLPAPVEFQLKWAQTMFYRERFDDLIRLLKPQIDEEIESQNELKVLMHLGLASLHSGQFKESLKYFAKVSERHSGSSAYAEALFRIGLLQFRLENYAAAVASFESYLKLGTKDDFEVSGRYWMWRAQQKLESPLAAKTAAALVADYPLSYYGLRVGVEIGVEKTLLPHSPAKAVESASLVLTQRQKDSWSVLQDLMAASWIVEARVEIDQLSKAANDPKALIFFSKLNALSQNFPKASGLMWPALRDDPSLRVKENIEVIFPRLFEELIQDLASRYDISADLVMGLIRQESSFRFDAYSTAGAAGFMQIMRPTAAEIAKDLRMKNFSPRTDLFKPELNLRIGINYLFRRIRNFDGKIPLALASYNAGIGNIKGWLRNRQDLPASELSTKDPLSEIWMDELPWLETSGYVKNILRNWLVYQLIADAETKVEFPVQ